jgi:general secretion pathway protein J
MATEWVPAFAGTRRKRFPRQGGFTLLEMLVVLVVLGFLVAGLTQGVRTGLALWGAQSRRLGETAELDAAARILRTLLSGIAPAASGGFAPGIATAAEFKGGSDTLAFIGDLPTGLGSVQRAEITLELQQRRLVLRWVPHRHELSTAPATPPIETELIRGVDRLDLAYWGSAAANQVAGWQPQWDGPATPELIRLRLQFAKGDHRHWPDLIAAPQP